LSGQAREAALERSGHAELAWGSALLAGVLSSCFAKKKVAKEEGDPRGRRRLRRSLALLGTGGGCGTRATPSDSPRPFSASTCVAQRLSWGPRKASRCQPTAKKPSFAVDLKRHKSQQSAHPSVTDGSPGSPWEALSNAGTSGAFGEDCLRA
jgi:hypothetical protein